MVGIRATLSQLSTFLRAYDDQLWAHLERDNGVVPQYYAFRWITLLLTQVGAWCRESRRGFELGGPNHLHVFRFSTFRDLWPDCLAVSA